MALLNCTSNLITTASELLDTLSTTRVEPISNLHFVIQFDIAASGVFVFFYT